MVIGLLALGIAALLTSIVHSDQEPIQVVPEPVKETILTPVQYADKYAMQYSVDANLFKKVMYCESSNNPKAIGDSGLARNVMQFHQATFNAYAKLMGQELDYNSYHDQIKLATWMWSKNLQYHWTCFKLVS